MSTEPTFQGMLNEIMARGRFQHWSTSNASYAELIIGDNKDCMKIQRSGKDIVSSVAKLHAAAMEYPEKTKKKAPY